MSMMSITDAILEYNKSGTMPNHFSLEAGRLLKQARSEKGWTQDVLAREIHKRREFISQVETGKKYLDVASLLILAQALEKPPQYFVPSFIKKNGVIHADKNESETHPTHWLGKTSTGQAWSVYRGDAFSILKTLPPKSIDCVVTSPPYYWQRDYSVDNQIGQETSIEGYVANIARVMDQIYRVLKPAGVVFLNIGDTYYSGKGEAQGRDKKNRKRRFGLRAVDASGGLNIDMQPKSLLGIPWRVAIELMRRKWTLRSSIIWVNDARIRETVKDRPSQSYEHIFMLTKQRKYHFDHAALDQIGGTDVWHTLSRPSLPKGIDTAPFPDEIVERCLAIGCPRGGTVLDPFAGSGTTLRVALHSSCHTVGIELNGETCRYIVSTLEPLSMEQSQERLL
jgi:DNA modification methylase/transcriptional regulator with XRE-family HTH domain